MENIKVFVMANIIITDADEYKNYEKGFFPILKKHNGTFITYDDSPDVLEGPKPLPGRVIIFTFPSEDDANNWWNDMDYQELSKHRRAATNATIQRIKGLPPRD